MKENTGLDTETLDGYAKLICDHTGDFKELNSFDDCLWFLTRTSKRNKYNWFFNIQYDFESIVKWLDDDVLKDLYREKEIQYNDDYKLKYIPKKYFVIQSKSNMNYYYYDMYNFLDGSLNTMSLKLLGEGKLLNRPCAKRIGFDKDYWIQERKRIIEYCIKDADLVKRLADKFWGLIYTNLNFYPKTPMSKGKLSEEYFLHTCNIPAINDIPEKVVKTAYDSYYGGHFELLKRGYFEKTYSYDIKSAYPAEIAKQPDYTKGKWEKVLTMNENCHTGFYSCNIIALESNFSPFMQKVGGSQGLNIYPNGKFAQHLTKEEILFFKEHFPNSVIKINFGYEFTPKELVYPFKTEIDRLYQWKEKEQNPDVKLTVKIILNSLYGKFIQVSGSMNQTGKLFNPMYAARITAGARLKILELALQKPYDIISFSTDSVISTVPLKVPTNPQLGDFQKDFEGEGVFIMSDVYNMWNDDTKKIKSKLRGFALVSTKDIDDKIIYLKDILAEMNETIYKYTTERPDHLGECIAHIKTKSIKKNLNVFSKHEKSININGDAKRVWREEFKKGKDCLKEQHDSLPILIQE